MLQRVKKAVAGGAGTLTALIQPCGCIIHQPIAAISDCNTSATVFLAILARRSLHILRLKKSLEFLAYSDSLRLLLATYGSTDHPRHPLERVRR